jgi:splicing factor 3A subunit 1
MITLTLPLKDMVSVIKAKLNDELTMPPAKQKLQIENIFLKDSNSLAFYNILPGRLSTFSLYSRSANRMAEFSAFLAY